LVEEEATVPVLTGLKEVIEGRGVFCALYSDAPGIATHRQTDFSFDPMG
jgi:hypothetical protein